MMRHIVLLATLLITMASPAMASQHVASVIESIRESSAFSSINDLPPFEKAVLIIRHFETLHRPCHWPTIGFGHVVQPGEPYRQGIQLTERQADALLRRDLRKFIAIYTHDFAPHEALLLGVLAYNVGPAAVNRSTLYRNLKQRSQSTANTANDTAITTAIMRSYLSFNHYQGRPHPGLTRRRLIEYALLAQ